MAEGKRTPRLPKQQLSILALCRFAEPVAMTSVYPYIPEMVQSFDVPTPQVAKWAGLMSAIFSFSQSLTGIAWGRASDRVGRKPMILAALGCTMLSGILFGFSRSLVWAFIARSLQGLSNGNVGIIRTAVAELVPEKELQPRAFSLMPLVWNVGSIFGPALGGALVRPAERFPGLFGKSQVFARYPFALPNLLNSLLFVIGIATGFLFLHETLEDRKHKRDYGLILGSLMTNSCRRRKRKPWRSSTDESQPFLSTEAGSALSSPTATKSAAPKLHVRPGWAEVFSRQSNINLVVYTLLAMHSVAYDQLMPIFMHHPVLQDPNTVHLPFKFSGGFGLSSDRIGLWFMIYGIYGMTIQFAIFPYLCRKWGVLNCLKVCAILFPVVYITTPFTALLPTSAQRQGVNLVVMLVKGFCAIFAFPCSTILLTNSAASLKILGTLNGVATSVSALGRATGPALAGAAFSLGVDLGYVSLSFWTLTLISLVAAVPIWYLEEMEGFNSNSDEDETDSTGDFPFEDEVDSEGSNAKTTSSDPRAGSLLRKTTTLTSADGIFEEPEDVPEDSAFLDPNALSEQGSDTPTQFLSRRTSLNLRRVSSPIGLGPGIGGPKARRYSSDLGATRSGLGTGGTSYH